MLTSMWLGSELTARADDTYYMIVFAYQGKPNLPRSSHTFATFARVPDGKDGKQQRETDVVAAKISMRAK